LAFQRSVFEWSTGEQYYYDPAFGVIDLMPEAFLRDETDVVDVIGPRRDGKRVHAYEFTGLL
jgi:hypothetical protein